MGNRKRKPSKSKSAKARMKLEIIYYRQKDYSFASSYKYFRYFGTWQTEEKFVILSESQEVTEQEYKEKEKHPKAKIGDSGSFYFEQECEII